MMCKPSMSLLKRLHMHILPLILSTFFFYKNPVADKKKGVNPASLTPILSKIYKTILLLAQNDQPASLNQ